MPDKDSTTQEWIDHIRETVYEQDSYRLRDLASEGFLPSRIVDVGYNLGFFSKLAAELWPHAHIVGIEPASDLDNYGPITPVRAALSMSPEVQLVYPKSNNIGARHVKQGGKIPGMKPQDLRQWGPVDLLKLDCEGGEHCFFGQGPLGWERTTILGEVHRRNPDNWDPWPITHRTTITHEYNNHQFEFRMTPR